VHHEQTIDGKQCIVLWHVNNLKVSHVDPKLVDEVLDQVDWEYGKVAPITVTRGRSTNTWE